MFLSFIFIIDLFYAQDTAARYIVSKEFSYRKLTCVWRVLVVHVARDCHEDDSHGKDAVSFITLQRQIVLRTLFYSVSFSFESDKD